jgi:hypothetical protein
MIDIALALAAALTHLPIREAHLARLCHDAAVNVG